MATKGLNIFAVVVVLLLAMMGFLKLREHALAAPRIAAAPNTLNYPPFANAWVDDFEDCDTSQRPRECSAHVYFTPGFAYQTHYFPKPPGAVAEGTYDVWMRYAPACSVTEVRWHDKNLMAKAEGVKTEGAAFENGVVTILSPVAWTQYEVTGCLQYPLKQGKSSQRSVDDDESRPESYAYLPPLEWSK